MLQKGVDHIGVTISFFCHDGKGNFVMGKRGANARDEQGRWDIGGGGLEFGEKVEDCLRKEIKEEYCADVLAHEFLGFRDVHREHDGKSTHWISLDFKVLVNHDEVNNGEPHKFDAVEWFTLQAPPSYDDCSARPTRGLPSPLHSTFHGFVEKYGAKLV